jgi:hypothetical protein
MGSTTPKAAASRMLGYITQYQIDAGRYPLTLHSRELPAAAANGHALLQRFVDEQIEYLTLKPKDHHNHPDWLYHKEHLRRHHEKARAAAQSPTVEVEAMLLGVEVMPGNSPTTTAPDLVFHRLGSGTLTAPTRKRQWLQKIAPATRPWHPMYLAYRNTARALRKAYAGKPINILFVGPAESRLARLIAGFPGSHYAAAPPCVYNADWSQAFAALPDFGIAVIELSPADLHGANAIYEAVTGQLRGPGPVILSWVNPGPPPSDIAIEQGLIGLLTLRGSDAEITFESSQAARRAIEWARWAWAPDRRAGRMARGGALILGGAWALVAALAHSWIRPARRPSPDCLSVTVLIDQKPTLRAAMSSLIHRENTAAMPEALSTR